MRCVRVETCLALGLFPPPPTPFRLPAHPDTPLSPQLSLLLFT
jgi:hypothetical protein